jgi:tetratricopeptide (TPR) repeat protein
MNRTIFYVSLVIAGVFAIIGLSFTKAHVETSPLSTFCEAMLARENGDWIKAERIWKEIIQRSPNTEAASAACLGSLMKDEGRLAEAEPLLIQAIDIDTRMFGPDSLEITTPMCQLAALYEQEHKLVLAQGLLTTVTRICTKFPERERAALQNAYAMSTLARIYIAEGQPELVTPALRQSEATYDRLLRKNTPSKRNFQLSCARACTPQD